MRPLDAATIEAWLSATQPRRVSLYGSYALLMAAVLGFMALLVLGPRLGLSQTVCTLVPLVLLAGFVVVAWFQGRRHQWCGRAVLAASQHLQLEERDAARAELEEIMRGSIRSISDRGEAFLLVAALAEAENRYDVAARVYESLLIRRIGDATQLQRAQIALAEAKLRNEELTDAVHMIGRLEQLPMPQAMRTTLDLVRLFQQVFMGHAEDAVRNIEERRSMYRRFLSTRAAYGYGLLAAALHALGRHDEAAKLWRDATTLMTTDRLIAAYDVLAPLARAYDAQEHAV
ncbi:MAG: hypothetical protein ABII12_08795 [Planctomycetota bacterium]